MEKNLRFQKPPSAQVSLLSTLRNPSPYSYETAKLSCIAAAVASCINVASSWLTAHGQDNQQAKQH
jgi:hypothetical protein